MSVPCYTRGCSSSPTQAKFLLPTAERGHASVLETVFEVLNTAIKPDESPDFDDYKPIPQLYSPFVWGRVLKEACNARTNSGQTSLILACMNG